MQTSMSRTYRRCVIGLYTVLILSIFVIGTFTHPSSTQAATPQLTIKFMCAQAVDYHYGTVCVHTQSQAALSITVKYCSGYIAVSRSLRGTRYASIQGNYSWQWRPETRCHGPAVAYVTAQWHGQYISESDNFMVL